MLVALFPLLIKPHLYGLPLDPSREGSRPRMTTGNDEEKLREVVDQHASDDPTVAARLYADADYLAQLRKYRDTPTAPR